MDRFRPSRALRGQHPLAPEAIRQLLADSMAPRHFFVGPEVQLEFKHVACEETDWEIFQGRLLDSGIPGNAATFEAWNVYLIQEGARSGAPPLSVKLDAGAGQVHVVRSLECYVWEGYDAGGNVFLSRAAPEMGPRAR